MQIEYVNEFNECGCHWTGRLAIVQHWGRGKELASNRPLNGFGSGSFSSSLDEGKALLDKAHPEGYDILLSIPVLVVRLNDA